MMHTMENNPAMAATVENVASTTVTEASNAVMGNVPTTTGATNNSGNGVDRNAQLVAALSGEISNRISAYMVAFFTRAKGSPVTEELVDGMLMRLQKICIDVVKG